MKTEEYHEIWKSQTELLNQDYSFSVQEGHIIFRLGNAAIHRKNESLIFVNGYHYGGSYFFFKKYYGVNVTKPFNLIKRISNSKTKIIYFLVSVTNKKKIMILFKHMVIQIFMKKFFFK